MDLTRDIYLEFSPYLELVTGVHTALSINEGIIKVIGPEGVGKTALCQKLERDLADAKNDVIYFADPPESAEYLHERIQNYLSLDKQRNFNKCLTEYLLAKSPPNNKLIVIYDNAEQIDKEVFILIRLLNNIHNDSETLVSQVICGTKKLDERFDDPDLRSLTQYLNQSFTLSPMDRNELEDFCAGYKKTMGYAETTTSDKELNNLFKKSKGLPGKAISLLDALIDDVQSEEINKDPSISEIVLENTITKSKDNLATTSESESITDPDPVSETHAESAPSSSNVPDVLEDIPSFTEYTEQEEPKGLPSVQQSETDAHEDYTQEVNEILDADDEHSSIPAPVYFKIALSAVVIVVTMILAIVLSGENETMDNRLAEILAADTPLFADEIEPQINTPATSPVNEDSDLSQIILADSNDGQPELAEDPVAATPLNDSEETSANESTVLLAESDVTGISNQVIPEPGLAEQESTDTAPSAEVSSDSVVVTSETNITDQESLEDTEEQIPELAFSAEGNNTEPAIDASSETLIESIAQEIPDRENDEDLSEEVVAETDPEVSELLPEDVITAVISSWLDAWQAGDFETYLAAYHSDFIPAYQDSVAEWRNQRQERINGVQGITTGFDRFELLEASDEEIIVRFWMYYSRNNYSDQTLKEIRFRLDNERWLILTERNIQIITE